MLDLTVIKNTVGELDEESLEKVLKEFVATKPTLEDAQKVVSACQQGMDIVGQKYSSGEYFVGDLIFAGELLTSSIDILRPVIGTDSSEVRGTIVLATAEGDIHDIGKNIFKVMSEAAGFKVIDLGVDQKPETIINAVKENKPEIVGLSGVLTLSIDSMKKTVDAIKAAGMRDGVKITIGGNAANADACAYVGADAWSTNAAEAVTKCGDWVAK